ncbi:LysM peptidoglycan-binding domain-containing protein [Anaerobacillus sp. MEB173]|uniref:cell division suppressor protein YneA n=1 Tax=Anaerobacillus sp. MEB173 TaxID=3383345 RepID=UPI003F93BBA5
MNNRISTNLQDLSYIVIFIVIIIMMMTSIVVSANSYNSLPTQEVIVKEGDTLWSIGEMYDTGLTFSELIRWVEKVNKIDRDKLYPGQTLMIPVASKE